MNMFKETTATPEEYFASLEEPRKSELLELDAMISAADPKAKRIMWSGIVGYGKMYYTSAAGKKIEWFLLGLSSRKNYISFYVSCLKEGQYLAESYKSKLPKAKIGRSCITFKKLVDVDKHVLKQLVDEAVQLTNNYS